MLVTLNEILPKARAEHYAVGLFNTTDTDMLEAAIGAAEELKSPIIIGTAEVLCPYGDLKLIAPGLIAAAKRARVPVVVHFDHGLTFEKTMEALKLGFSSVMFDASAKDHDMNLAETAEVVKIAHSFGASVEGEIGHVGVAADCDNDKTDMYTTPEEAAEFIDRTGVDALAVAIGSAHGVYKTKPQLNIKRLTEIAARVNEPLVLHGGSGLSDDDFRNTIREGIAKVNIFTDICLAGLAAMQEGLGQKLTYVKTRNLKVEKMKAAVMKKIELFGCAGKA